MSMSVLYSCDSVIYILTSPLLAAGPQGQTAGAGGPQMNQQMMEEMSKRLSDPATADLISTFVQSMKPEDLASMLKQSGMDVNTQQVMLSAQRAKQHA